MRLVRRRPARRRRTARRSRSSCSPGPSPTNSRSAVGSPTPNTTCVRVSASGHFVHARAPSRSRIGERGERERLVRAATRRDPTLSEGAGLSRTGTRPGVADALGRHLGDHHAEAVEVGVDRAGRDTNARSPSWRVCDGWIARARPSWALLSEQVALDLGAAGVGGDDHQRRVGPARRLLERRRSGKPGASAGRASTRRACRPSSPTTSPTAFTTAMRTDDDVAVVCRSPCRARRWCRGRHPATWRRAPRDRHRRVRSASAARRYPGGGERGAALVGPGRTPPDATRSKIAAVGTIGTGPPRVAEAAALLRREPASRRRRRRDRTPNRPTARSRRRCSTVAGRSSTAVSASPVPRRGSRRADGLGETARRSRRWRAPVQCPACTPGTSVITSAGRGGAGVPAMGGSSAGHRARSRHDERVDLRRART